MIRPNHAIARILGRRPLAVFDADRARRVSYRSRSSRGCAGASSSRPDPQHDHRSPRRPRHRRRRPRGDPAAVNRRLLVGIVGIVGPVGLVDDQHRGGPGRRPRHQGLRVGVSLVVSARTFDKLGGLVGVNHLLNQQQLSGLTTRVIVAPNQDTLYSIATVDLRHGPVVLTVPDVTDRYWTYQLLDSWTTAFAYVGNRGTGGKGGTFVITPPGWTGTLPAGAHRISSPADQMFLLGRFLVSGPSDVPNVVAITAKATLKPLDPAAPAPAGAGCRRVTAAGARRASSSSTSSETPSRSTRPSTAGRACSARQLAALGIGPGRHPSSRSPTPPSRGPRPALPSGQRRISSTPNGPGTPSTAGASTPPAASTARTTCAGLRCPRSVGVRTSPRRRSTRGPRSTAPAGTSTAPRATASTSPPVSCRRSAALVAHALRARRLLHRQLPRPLRHRRPHPGPHPEPRRLARPLRAARRPGREGGQLAACPDRAVQPDDAAVPAQALGARRHLAAPGGHPGALTPLLRSGQLGDGDRVDDHVRGVGHDHVGVERPRVRRRADQARAWDRRETRGTPTTPIDAGPR